MRMTLAANRPKTTSSIAGMTASSKMGDTPPLAGRAEVYWYCAAPTAPAPAEEVAPTVAVALGVAEGVALPKPSAPLECLFAPSLAASTTLRIESLTSCGL